MRADRLLVVLATATASVVVALGADVPDENRQALERARRDPERYTRLARDARAFLLLPAEEQARMRRLDQELRRENSAAYARLHRVMERYADWLESVPDADRQRITAAPDGEARLREIREVRERQWESRLPRAYRDELKTASAEARAALVRHYRDEDRERQRQWRIALRHWDELLRGAPPSRLKDFPQPVQSFVAEHLRPRLSTEEIKRLEAAEGQWPLYPQTLVALTDKHTPVLLGPTTGPTRFAELPTEVRKVVREGWERMHKDRPPAAVPRFPQVEGKWPDYALRVTEFARRNKIEMPRQLGPCAPDEFVPGVRSFISNTLTPALAADERTRLERALHKWPQYPRLVMELARKHQMQVPGMGLPGQRAYWDRYRTPDDRARDPDPQVPDRTLREFARNELTPQQRAEMNVPASSELSLEAGVRERLRQEYFKRHPREWDRLRHSDERKDAK
jgi:hypothetical protein